MDDRPLKRIEVEQRLGLHRNTVAKLLNQGAFPNAFKAEGRWRIPAADIEAYINRNRKELA